MATIKKYFNLPFEQLTEELYDDNEELKNAINTLARTYWKTSCMSMGDSKRLAIAVMFNVITIDDAEYFVRSNTQLVGRSRYIQLKGDDPNRRETSFDHYDKKAYKSNTIGDFQTQ